MTTGDGYATAIVRGCGLQTDKDASRGKVFLNRVDRAESFSHANKHYYSIPDMSNMVAIAICHALLVFINDIAGADDTQF